MNHSTIYDIPVTRIDGTEGSLQAFRGKTLLIVNVASNCGLTPQYAGLEALYQAKRTQGLEVLGFPANNFKEQEPGSDAEIQAFCTTNYDVHFPLFTKISVVGPNQHPLYRYLTQAAPEAIGEGPMRARLQGFGIAPNPAPDILWNFEKFLVDRQGKVAARFAPDVVADDPRLTKAVEDALGML